MASPPKLGMAAALTGDEGMVVVQAGKPVRTPTKTVAQLLGMIGLSLTDPQKQQARDNIGLGTAATKATGDFATAAQGTKADTAVQPAALDTKLGIPGAPNPRSLSFGVAYQATNAAKSAFVSITVETTYTVTLIGTLSDTVELRYGPDATTVANGTGGYAIPTFKSSLTGVNLTIGMGITQRNQLAALIPPGWYFAVRRVAGTTAIIQQAMDQAL